MEKASPAAKGRLALTKLRRPGLTALPQSSAGAVGGRNRGKVLGCEGGAEPGPTSGPGFACYPLARSAAENSIITAGESGDWERKIRDQATLGSACAPAALHPKHTHIFPPDLEKSPKAAPSAGKRLGALPPPRPPRPPQPAAFPGCFSASPPSGCSPPPPGAAACSRERASERAIERASQPASQPACASGGCHPTPAVREAGDTEGWHPGAGRGASPAAARECPARDSGEGEGCCSWGLLQLRGRRGSGEEGGARRECRTLQIGWGRLAVRARGAGAREYPVITLPLRLPQPRSVGSCALRGREEGRGEGRLG